jgi:hypothetical protein
LTKKEVFYKINFLDLANIEVEGVIALKTTDGQIVIRKALPVVGVTAY